MRWRPEIIATAVAVVCLSTFVVAGQAASPAKTNNNDVTRQAALYVGVKPPSSAPRFLKRLAWRLEKRFLQLMSWLDPCSPPDSKLSLRVLWWKAVAANDVSSPVYEQDSLTYDMLPSGFRWLVSQPLCQVYPRWTHVIIEIRTAYLDQVISRIRNTTDPSTKLRLVALGGGYDVRSIRLVLRGVIDEAVELDLTQVIEAKQKILQRLCRRRPNQDIVLPTFYAIDLTQVDKVEETLMGILTNKTDSQRWNSIFLFEGVLMYLPEGVSSELFQAIRKALDVTQEQGSIIFADALENIPNDDIDSAQQELARHGWKVVEWQPKGGRTRHMGNVEMLTT